MEAVDLSLHVLDNSVAEDPVPVDSVLGSNCDVIEASKDGDEGNEGLVDPGCSPAGIAMQVPGSPRLSPLLHSCDSDSDLSRKRKADEGEMCVGIEFELDQLEGIAVERESEGIVSGGVSGCVSSGRVLRSRKVEMSPALTQSRERRTQGRKGIEDGLVSSSGKVLRSGKVAVSTVGLKRDDEDESGLIEFGDDQEGRQTPVKVNNRPKAGNGKGSDSSSSKAHKQKSVAFFVGEPVPDVEAREKWNWRYQLKVIHLFCDGVCPVYNCMCAS